MTLSRLVVINKREVFAQSDGQRYAMFECWPEQGAHRHPGHGAHIAPSSVVINWLLKISSFRFYNQDDLHHLQDV